MILLLDCMERWARVEPYAADSKGSSEFAKVFQGLQQKRVFFPSQCRMSNPLIDFGMVEEANMRTASVQNPKQPSSRSKSEYKKEHGAG